MLTPSPCRTRKPTLFQNPRARISSGPARVERSLEIKRVHSHYVQIVTLARAFKQIENRTTLFRGVSKRCGPGCQLEWISGHRCNLLSLCIDETSKQRIEYQN